jgi:hypothetical protein
VRVRGSGCRLLAPAPNPGRHRARQCRARGSVGRIANPFSSVAEPVPPPPLHQVGFFLAEVLYLYSSGPGSYFDNTGHCCPFESLLRSKSSLSRCWFGKLAVANGLPRADCRDTESDPSTDVYGDIAANSVNPQGALQPHGSRRHCLEGGEQLFAVKLAVSKVDQNLLSVGPIAFAGVDRVC